MQTKRQRTTITLLRLGCFIVFPSEGIPTSQVRKRKKEKRKSAHTLPPRLRLMEKQSPVTHLKKKKKRCFVWILFLQVSVFSQFLPFALSFSLQFVLSLSLSVSLASPKISTFFFASLSLSFSPYIFSLP